MLTVLEVRQEDTSLNDGVLIARRIGLKDETL